MSTVRDVLGTKAPGVWDVAPGATVYEALERMAEKDVGALVVVEDGGLVGIFSERDYARRVILAGRSSREMRVRDLMVAPVLTVRPDQSIDECMALMTERRVRHLPVVEDGALVGIVTIGDVVKRILAEREATIEHLENYITGSELAGGDEPSPGRG